MVNDSRSFAVDTAKGESMNELAEKIFVHPFLQDKVKAFSMHINGKEVWPTEGWRSLSEYSGAATWST